MIVSEKASNQDDLADCQLCSSIAFDSDSSVQCLGVPERGGWKPILERQSSGKPILIDWYCPSCKKPIYKWASGSAVCQLCGLAVKEYPTKKVDKSLPKSKKMWMYSHWIDGILYPEEEQ